MIKHLNREFDFDRLCYRAVHFSGPLFVGGVEVADESGNVVAPLQLAGGEDINDANGNELVSFTATASAVNNIGIKNSATGVNPIIYADGEADTGLTFTNSELEEILILDAVASAINEVTVTNAAIGNGPTIAATGTDTNIPVTLKGKGTGPVQLGQATSTDVRLVADQPIADSSGNELLKFVKTTTAVNEITVTNAATGAATAGPKLSVTGGDTNSSFLIAPLGTGNVSIQGARGIVSSVSNGFFPVYLATVQQALSGPGAINVTSHYTAWTTTGADAGTLASGAIVGQIKKVQQIVDGGDGTLTFNGTSTIVFADAGDFAVLMWTGTAWMVLELGNGADGATAPVYTP